MKNWILVLMLATACQTPASHGPPEEFPYPEVIRPVWEAHGGIENWKEFGLMEFTIGEGTEAEAHSINLWDRRVLIEADSFRLGMDGERIWVEPSLEAFGRDPRFYHNLIFYFSAIPFVFADPGVNLNDTGIRQLNNKEYPSISVSFEEGTGDADQDEYIMLINPETNRLEWLLYTPTYFSPEKAESFNALHYEDYRDVNGLMVAGKLSGYTYANDTTGERRYENRFFDQSFNRDPLPDNTFEKPAGAVFLEDE